MIPRPALQKGRLERPCFPASSADPPPEGPPKHKETKPLPLLLPRAGDSNLLHSSARYSPEGLSEREVKGLRTPPPIRWATPVEPRPPPTKKEAPEGIKEEGWVYVVRNQDLHKIGITKDLIRRMRQLKADDKGNELIDAIKSDRYKALERTLHKIFKEKRIPQSEYFRLNPIQVKELQRMMRKEISSS